MASKRLLFTIIFLLAWNSLIDRTNLLEAFQEDDLRQSINFFMNSQQRAGLDSPPPSHISFWIEEGVIPPPTFLLLKARLYIMILSVISLRMVLSCYHLIKFFICKANLIIFASWKRTRTENHLFHSFTNFRLPRQDLNRIISENLEHDFCSKKRFRWKHSPCLT